MPKSEDKTRKGGTGNWTRIPLICLMATVAGTGAQPVEAGLPFAAKGHHSNYILRDTRAKDLDPFFFQSPFFPALNDPTKVTTIVKRYPFDPRLLGMPRAKGSINVQHSCIDGRGGDRGLGRSKAKFDAFGNAASVKTIPGGADCIFHRAETTFKGNQRQGEGTSVSTTNVVQRLPANVDSDCFDRDVLCLLNGRFKVELGWNDDTGSGTAVPVATGFDEGLFFFFDPEASGLLINVLDGCDVNNAFAVFARAATDVGFTLTVTDTREGVIKEYTNPLGQPAPAIVDTQAFATCP